MDERVIAVVGAIGLFAWLIAGLAWIRSLFMRDRRMDEQWLRWHRQRHHQ